MTLGLLSDTHDRLDPAIAHRFAGVHRILHAGDVGRPQLIAELARVAPVTVVRGNTDAHPGWRESESIEIEERRFLIEHIVSPHQPSPGFRQRLSRIQPHVVVFGHTHRPFHEVLDGVLYLNPGSAGAPRYGLPPSVCLLHFEPRALRPEFIDLSRLTPSP